MEWSIGGGGVKVAGGGALEGGRRKREAGGCQGGLACLLSPVFFNGSTFRGGEGEVGGGRGGGVDASRSRSAG